LFLTNAATQNPKKYVLGVGRKTKERL